MRSGMSLRAVLVFSLALAILGLAAGPAAADSTFTGPNKTNGDNWNVVGNWNSGAGPIPSGTDSVVITTSKQVTAYSAATPLYSGSLSIGNNALLQIGYNGGLVESYNALGTPGTTIISMGAGSQLAISRIAGTYTIPAINLLGNAIIRTGESTNTAPTLNFNHGISGAYTVTFQGKSDSKVNLNTANSFSALVADWTSYTSSGMTITAGAAGSLGTGDVTVKPYTTTGASCAKIVIGAADAMADTATLTLNGSTTIKLTMNANDTIGNLVVADVQQSAGTYTSASGWISGTGNLTVTPPKYWAAAGGETPNGTWSVADTNWNSAADGSGTAAGWTSNDLAAGQTAVFAAGTGATGAYTVTVVDTQTFAGMVFEDGAATLTGGTALQMIADSSVKVAAGKTATIETPITQDATARQLLKTGEGTLVLSGVNNYAGATSVVGGTLQLGASNVLPDTSVTVSGNTPGATATLALNGNNDTIGSLTLGGAAVTTGAGTLTLGGNVTYANANNPLGATISGKLDLGGATRTFTVDDSSTAANDLTVSADISGTGAGLTKAGAGTLLLSGTNSYDGVTTVSAGILRPVNTAALPSYDSAAKVVVAGGTLAVRVGVGGGTDWSTGEIDTLLASATKTSGALGIDTTNGDLAQWTAFTTTNLGGLGLAKLGNNKLTLDQANTYTGVTTVYAGTLTAGAGQTSAFGTSGSLAFGAGSTGKVQLNGNHYTFTSLTTNATVGTPIVENASATPATLTVNNSGANTYAGVLQDGTGGGALSLVKAGTGTLTLRGTNTYSGGTVINAGSVNVGSDAHLGAASGGLTFNGTSNITYSDGLVLNANRTVTINQGANVSLSNAITVNGILTGSGSFSVNTADAFIFAALLPKTW